MEICLSKIDAFKSVTWNLYDAACCAMNINHNSWSPKIGAIFLLSVSVVNAQESRAAPPRLRGRKLMSFPHTLCLTDRQRMMYMVVVKQRPRRDEPSDTL